MKTIIIKMLPQSWDVLMGPFKATPFNHLSTTLSLMLSPMLLSLSFLIESYLGINSTVFIMIIAINVLDFVAGIAAAKKQKQVFCAAKGVRTLIKLGAYLTFIFCLNAIKNSSSSIIPGIEPLLSLVHYYLSIHIFLWEAKSVNDKLKILGINLGLTKLFDNLRKKINKSSDLIK